VTGTCRLPSPASPSLPCLTGMFGTSPDMPAAAV
jgi:XapX domain-containing protein